MYRSSSILLVCLVALVGSAHAKLRGNIDIVNDLQARATNPTLRADIRGKSVRELLGDNYHDLPQEKDRRVDAPPTQQKGRRRTHAGRKNRQSLQQQQQQPRELSNVQDIPQQKGSTGRSLQQTDSATRAIQFFTVSEHSAVGCLLTIAAAVLLTQHTSCTFVRSTMNTVPPFRVSARRPV